jgi:hypothetical protein
MDRTDYLALACVKMSITNVRRRDGGYYVENEKHRARIAS